jgi:hypothetical protein
VHRAALGVFSQGQRQSNQQSVSAIGAQGAIELMRELNGFSRVTAMSGQGRQRDGERAQGNGVVGSDDTLIVQTEAAGKVEAARQAAKVGSGVGGGTCEALVVIGAEASEHGVGLVDGGGLSQAKFADQTVLAGAPGALDAALGLRRVGGNLLDAELVESASELSGRLFSGKLFGQRPVGIVALEDGVSIAVEAEPRVFSASSWK